jgi:hypothetical protein
MPNDLGAKGSVVEAASSCSNPDSPKLAVESDDGEGETTKEPFMAFMVPLWSTAEEVGGDMVPNGISNSGVK